MRLNRNLAFTGIALIVAACSSKTTDDDDTGNGGVGAGGNNVGNVGGNNVGNVGGNNAGNVGGNNVGNVGGNNAGNVGGNNVGNVGGNNVGNVGGNNNATVGGGGNAGDGNQAGDNSAGGSCTVKSVRATLTPPAIEFQVDITNSMTQTTPTTGGQSKWAATQAALNAVLPKLDPNWLVGFTFFNKPGPQDTGCYAGQQSVDIAPLGSNLAAISSAIAGINLDPNVSTWTPTLNAWQFAFDYITGLWPERAQYTGSNKYIVFMTDGVPTVNRNGCTTGNSCTGRCIDQAEYDYFVSVIQGAGVPNGIKTFFIGVPGSETAQGAPYDPRVMLSEMAIAGGTAPANCTAATAAAGQYCHIDLTQATDFATALASAIQYTVGDLVKPQCDFDIPKPSDAATYINLSYTTVDFVPAEGAAAQRLERAPDSTCTTGQYYYNDPDKPTQLKLCPTMCDQLGATTSGSVQINFECSKIG